MTITGGKLKFNLGSIQILQFTLLIIFTAPSLIQSSECSFGLWPYKTVSIDVLTCKADTLSGSIVYDIDVDTIKGHIAYGTTGCPACMGCSCGEAIVGKDSLYKILDLEKLKDNDSIDFSDTNQVKVSSIIDLFNPFVFKNGDTLAVCWVKNYPTRVTSGSGDPGAGIISCISRIDGVSHIDFSSVNPGYRVGIIQKKGWTNCQELRSKVYDHLGRQRLQIQ